MYAIYAGIRDSKGLTDAMVSAATGIKPDAFSKWKRRSEEDAGAALRLESMLKLCEFLEISINVFSQKEE